MLRIILLLLIACMSFSAVSHANTEGSAVSLSYEELTQVSPSSPEFLDAFMELQKIHYKEQQWDRFFAYSLFYRHKLLSEKSQWKANFRSKLFSLEILALSKHCLWEEAKEIAEEGLRIVEELGLKEDQEIQNTLIFIPPLKNLAQLRGKVTKKDIPESVMKETHYWPVQTKYIKLVQHPKSLRLKIESRCVK